MAEPKAAKAPTITRDMVKKLNSASKEQLIMDLYNAQSYYMDQVRSMEQSGSEHEIEKNKMNHRHNIVGSLITGGVTDPDTLITSSKKIEEYMRGDYDKFVAKMTAERAASTPPRVSTLIKS